MASKHLVSHQIVLDSNVSLSHTWHRLSLIFMMQLRGLVFFLFCLAGGARRTAREGFVPGVNPTGKQQATDRRGALQAAALAAAAAVPMAANAKAGQFSKLDVFSIAGQPAISSPYQPGGPRSGKDATYGYKKSDGPIIAAGYESDVTREKKAFEVSKNIVNSQGPNIERKRWWLVRDNFRGQAYNMKANMQAINEVLPADKKKDATKAFNKFWAGVNRLDLALTKKEPELARKEYDDVEAALQSKPNILLLTEEVDEKRQTLREVVNSVADIVTQCAAAGKNFGTVLVAEGLLATIPEFRSLIKELEGLSLPLTVEKALPQLTQWSRAFFQSLPEFIQEQLLLERQSNDELQLDKLETERLMAALVEEELALRKKHGTFKGSFSPVCQHLGYPSRCSMPSDFDSDYAYTLGGADGVLAATGKSGYMAIVSGLSKPVQEWRVGGVPFTVMVSVPRSLPHEVTQPRPAILPQPVDLEGKAWKSWCSMRGACAQEELYENPGPIQFSGASAGRIAVTIESKSSYIQELNELRENLEAVTARCRPGCDPRNVLVAVKSLATLNTIMDELVTGR